MFFVGYVVNQQCLLFDTPFDPAQFVCDGPMDAFGLAWQYDPLPLLPPPSPPPPALDLFKQTFNGNSCSYLYNIDWLDQIGKIDVRIRHVQLNALIPEDLDGASADDVLIGRRPKAEFDLDVGVFPSLDRNRSRRSTRLAEVLAIDGQLGFGIRVTFCFRTLRQQQLQLTCDVPRASRRKDQNAYEHPQDLTTSAHCLLL